MTSFSKIIAIYRLPYYNKKAQLRKGKRATAFVYRTQLTKSPLTCMGCFKVNNNLHLFTQKCAV